MDRRSRASLIRSASLSNYAAVARSVGLDPLRMIAAVGLDRACLMDPDRRVPIDAVRRLFEASARVAGIEDFGLRVARTRQLSTLGPLGLVVQEQPTLRAALDTLVRYMRVHNESLWLRVDEEWPVVVVSQDLGGDGNAMRQSAELAVAMSLRVIQALLGAEWRPLRVLLAHPRPQDMAGHRQVFGSVPIEFLASRHGIVCRAHDLSRPLPAADPELARYARQYLESLAARTGSTFSDGVRQLVLTLLPAGQCSVERVAEHLALDRRTIHRRLLAERTTFSAIVDDVRDDVALRQLGSGARPLAELAEMLGFAGLSAFSRWFRRRHGCTASAWRRRGTRDSAG